MQKRDAGKERFHDVNIGRPSSFRNATFESYEASRNNITRKEGRVTGNGGVGRSFFWKRNEPTFSSYTNHISQDIIIIYITVANGRIFLTREENSIIL